MTDFIIVGRGLAATVLMHRFYRQGIRFKVIGDAALSSCSAVAAGIWNPVVFKRMSKSWMAERLIPSLDAFYSDCETLLGQKLVQKRRIARPFIEEQEKTLWRRKAQHELAGFLDPDIKPEKIAELENCPIPGDYGFVEQAGNLDMPLFLESSSAFFSEHLVNAVFDHARLQVFDSHVAYDQYEARNIIFCEGYLVKHNPFFSWIPLKPAKGEILTISSSRLALRETIYNRDAFVLRQNREHLLTGATYAWNFTDQAPSPEGRQELLNKLQKLVSCEFTVISHKAGIRPASIDRRPIIGRHPRFPHLYVFNGLGTKGVMLAPWFSENFVHFFLQNTDLNPEVNVKRFYHIYEEQQKKQD